LPKRSTEKSIQLIQESLVGLAKGLGGLLPLLNARNGNARVDVTSERRALNLSAKTRAFRKLQGSYMGYLRNLPAREKARVKAVRVAKGYPAALKLAKRLAAR
jgi:hypothetical protein